tara:strand:+ start:390 stop:731 length:342 start_codon:yes stop_codon:yes gene_type:complete
VSTVNPITNELGRLLYNPNLDINSLKAHSLQENSFDPAKASLTRVVKQTKLGALLHSDKHNLLATEAFKKYPLHQVVDLYEGTANPTVTAIRIGKECYLKQGYRLYSFTKWDK